MKPAADGGWLAYQPNKTSTHATLHTTPMLPLTTPIQMESNFALNFSSPFPSPREQLVEVSFSQPIEADLCSCFVYHTSPPPSSSVSPPLSPGPLPPTPTPTPTPPPPPAAAAPPLKAGSGSGAQQQTPQQQEQRFGKRGSGQAFALGLFQILKTEDPKVIGWSRSGKAFRIGDSEKFCRDIMPRFFKREYCMLCTEQHVCVNEACAAVDHCTMVFLGNTE